MYPVFDQSGEVILVTKHVRDITENKRVETALRESEQYPKQLIEQYLTFPPY